MGVGRGRDQLLWVDAVTCKKQRHEVNSDIYNAKTKPGNHDGGHILANCRMDWGFIKSTSKRKATNVKSHQCDTKAQWSGWFS